MGSSFDSTLSSIDVGATAATDSGRPALFVVLESSRPWAGSSRHLLSDIDAIEFGRGEERGASRSAKTLRITIPDRWMSSQHARIEKRAERWILSDHDSKNGTSVNGIAVRSQPLADGDLIGVGHTLLRLRSRIERAADEPLDADSRTESWSHDALATLIPTLAAEFCQATRLAHAADIPFLIRGESGTGKEVLANAVHSLSNRSGDLIAVNCGAIAANLVESELFGHVRGAFSGAHTDKLGLIRSADGGTLLLDEIGDLALPSQTALLRVLQEREVVAVGASKPVPVDLRILSATHRDLDSMVAAGSFRGDLYARLAGYSVTLPPLRDRLDDIGVIVASLIDKLGIDTGSHPGFSLDCASAIATYRWPMNIRELSAALRAAFALAADKVVTLDHLPAPVRGTAGASDPDDDQKLRSLLSSSLRTHAGNISAVARELGKDRKQIQRWLKRFNLDPSAFR